MGESLRIGIDIGGTFTDFAVIDDAAGTVVAEKILTTHAHPEDAVLDGIDRLARRHPDLLARAGSVIHATTLVTNTILERKGARTALVTTEGFRDVLEMAREVRYDVFDMFIRMPRPVIPRRLRFEVAERVLATGEVRTPLDEDGVRAAARAMRAAGVEAVAVVFLHSYRRPEHERRAGEILAEELPGAVVSLSSDVHPEPKEYERASTTALDAYVKRVTATYLDAIAAGLSERGWRGRLLVMLSNGGSATVETARAVPVQLVESGPAAGVEAACHFGRLMGLERVLSFDMGGTTAKLCVIENGAAARTRAFEVDRMHRFKAGSGLPVAVPVYDLLEIGAGGGSIAKVDDLGLLKVGPESAGSEPGPAAYGRGGERATVTDADLVLGYLDPDSFLGGAMSLDLPAAEAAIERDVAGPAGLATAEAAAGIHEIVNESMASAARMYVAEKGRSPSEFTLMAFGGAGPVHALGLARKLGVPRVVVPPFSGVMSSLGLLSAPVAFERSHAVRRLADDADPADLEALFARLEAEARAMMPEEGAPVCRRTVDLRHAGQDHALEVAAGEGPVSAGALAAWVERFMGLYEQLYGKVDDETPVEIASLRVVLSIPVEGPRLCAVAGSGAAPRGRRRIHVSLAGGLVTAAVYRRERLGPGDAVTGPAVVEERESTTVLLPGDRLTVHPTGCLAIEVAQAAGATTDAAVAEAGRCS